MQLQKLPVPQQGVQVGVKGLARKNAPPLRLLPERSPPVFSGLPFPYKSEIWATAAPGSNGTAAISAAPGSNGTWICTSGSVGTTGFAGPTGSVVTTITSVLATGCVTITGSIGSGGGRIGAVHAARIRRPSSHKRQCRESRRRTAAAKGAESEDVCEEPLLSLMEEVRIAA